MRRASAVSGPVARPIHDGSANNVNVNANRDDGTNVEDMSALLRPLLRKAFTDYKFEDEGFVTIDGKKVYYLSSSCRQGSWRIRNLQYCISGDNGKVYVAAFTASVDAFAAARPIFEMAAETMATD